MTRWRNVEMAEDEHGNGYVRVTRRPIPAPSAS